MEQEILTEGYSQDLPFLIEDCAKTYELRNTSAKLIGTGSNGTVYKLGEEAHKIVPTADQRQKRNAQREFFLLRRVIGKPNVIQVLGEPSEHRSAQDIGFMVIKYNFVEGETLAAKLKENEGRFNPQTVGALLGTNYGLQSLEKEGIVHRDIKPSNIIVTENSLGSKICDFSIAVDVYDQPEHTIDVETGEARAIGTPRYMSPEAIYTRDVCLRTDLYSLGIVTYEALVGECLFEGNSLANIFHKNATFNADTQDGRQAREKAYNKLKRATNRDLAQAWMLVMQEKPDKRNPKEFRKELQKLYDKLTGNIPDVRN